MWICYSSPHPAAAEPPSDISAIRDPPNGSNITITWSEPTTGATPTGYFIHYQVGGDQGNMTVDSNTTMAEITLKSTELVYCVTMVTLSAITPSKPSKHSYGKT